MSNNLDITIHDFNNICRTCLSRENLQHLYEKGLSEKLMFFTYVTFAEDDDLPIKICANCIYDINQAFSFAKRCETTDKILRECFMKPEFAKDSSEPIIKAVTEIKSEIISLDTHHVRYVKDVTQKNDIDLEYQEIIVSGMYQSVEEVLKDIEEVKPDENAKIENEESIENKQEENDNTEYECVDLTNEDNDEDQNKTDSGKCDNSGSERKLEVILDSNSKNVCSVSNKPFKLNLNKRKRLHTGTYTCEICCMNFMKVANLKKHLEIHTAERPYDCEVCSKTFIRLHHLKRHMRIHTGEKPFSCEICRMSFIRSENMKRHMKNHDKLRPVSRKTRKKNSIVHKRIHNEYFR